MPTGSVGVKLKLKPSAGGRLPEVSRTLKLAVKAETRRPGARLLMLNQPLWEPVAGVSLSTPLLSTPPVVSTMATPLVIVPAGRPDSKLLVNVTGTP